MRHLEYYDLIQWCNRNMYLGIRFTLNFAALMYQEITSFSIIKCL